MTSREEVLAILLECVRGVAAQSGSSSDIGEGTVLLGSGSPVDSLGLVMVVSDFEGRLNQEYDARVVLATEAAMSLSRSPFRTVASLADYGLELLQQAPRP